MRSIFAALILASATLPALGADPSPVFYGRAIGHEVIEDVREKRGQVHFADFRGMARNGVRFTSHCMGNGLRFTTAMPR